MNQRLVPSLLLCVAAVPLFALERSQMGPRATGMAGSNTASVNDSTALYFNPGTLAFFCELDETGERKPEDNNNLGNRDADIDIGVNVAARITGNLAELWDEFQELDTVLDRLGGNGVASAQDAQEIVRLARLLTEVDDPGKSLQVSLGFEAGLRLGHLAVGGRVHSVLHARVEEVDTDNLGLGGPSYTLTDLNNDLVATLDGSNGRPAAPSEVVPTYITPGSDLETNLLAAGYTSDAIAALEYQLQQGVAEGTLTQDQITGVVDIVAQAGTATSLGSGDIANNRTRITALGYSAYEIPVGYGYAVNDAFSVGATVRFIQGRVYGVTVRVYDEDFDQVQNLAEDNYQDTSTLGLDLGVMYRLPKLQLGLTARNLNTPTFDGFEQAIQLRNTAGDVIDTINFLVPDAELEPEASLGVAFIPWNGLTLEADVDLLEHTLPMTSYNIQYVSLGVEWELLRVLALRGGFTRNLAESDIGNVVTLGLGFDFRYVSIDFAGGMALDERTELDGTNVPNEVFASVGLSAHW